MNTIIDNLKLNKIEVLDLEKRYVSIEPIVEIAKILSTNSSSHKLKLNCTRVGVEETI